MKKIILLCLCLASWTLCQSQEMPLHISNTSIYDFLDRMANNKFITLNSTIKPYAREEVCRKLLELEQQSEKLSKTQRKELQFFLMEFNLERYAEKKEYKANLLPKQKKTNLCFYPLGFFYGDSTFRLSIKPIGGIKGFFYGNSKDEMGYHRWGGAQMQGYIGKHVSFYMSLVDNKFSQAITGANMLTSYPAALLKGQTANTDYAEARGGLTVTWKWASLSVQKDNVEWGESYNSGNIFSGRAPSFVMLKLRLKPAKWFEFNYFHGWLASNVEDSSRSAAYDNKRIIMRDKKIAANMLTFTPCKGLDISLGNSIVYSDKGFQFQYIIPFLFYKATDDIYNGTFNNAGQNSQLYLSISSRNVKHLHLYASLFIDEISFERLLKKDKQSNYLSIKTGFRLSDLPKNMNITFEYTANTPNVYQHFIKAQDFTSSEICMGSYLKSNAQEFYGAINYRPFAMFDIDLSYTCQMKGTDYEYGIGEPWGLPFMKEVILENHIIGLKLNYEFLNNSFVYLESYFYKTKGDSAIIQKFNPPYYQKSSGIMIMSGINIGF